MFNHCYWEINSLFWQNILNQTFLSLLLVFLLYFCLRWYFIFVLFYIMMIKIKSFSYKSKHKGYLTKDMTIKWSNFQNDNFAMLFFNSNFHNSYLSFIF